MGRSFSHLAVFGVPLCGRQQSVAGSSCVYGGAATRPYLRPIGPADGRTGGQTSLRARRLDWCSMKSEAPPQAEGRSGACVSWPGHTRPVRNSKTTVLSPGSQQQPDEELGGGAAPGGVERSPLLVRPGRDEHRHQRDLAGPHTAAGGRVRPSPSAGGLIQPVCVCVCARERWD